MEICRVTGYPCNDPDFTGPDCEPCQCVACRMDRVMKRLGIVDVPDNWVTWPGKDEAYNSWGKLIGNS